MALVHILQRYSLPVMVSLSMLLGGCGGGGGGSAPTPAPPPFGGTPPVPPPATSAPVPPSAPPPTDSGTPPPPATGGSTTPPPPPPTPPAPTPPAPPPAGVYEAFRVSIDSRELVFKGEQGGSLAPALLVGTGAGIPPSTIYTGSVDLGSALDRVLVEVDGMQVNFRVYPKWNLAPGEHRGSLQLFACPDEKCAQHFAGSPVTIPYTISVARGFIVPTGTLTLGALSGATASTQVEVQVPDGASGFAVKSFADWLTISDITPTGFKATAQPMPPGHFSSKATIVAGGRSKDVQFEYVVASDASTITRISPSRENIDLGALVANSAGVTLDVTLPSWSTVLDAELSFNRDDPSDWLTLAKTGERRLALTASAATLAPGRYQAMLTLRSGTMASPVGVPVSFTVGVPSWRLAGNTHFAVSAATNAAQLGSTVTVELPQVPSQQWTASTSSPWLQIAAGSGTTGGTPLRVTVDGTQLAALENFASHSADVVLNASDTRVPPTTLRFTLDKALPEVHYVSPGTRLPNEAGSYILRGRGFDSVTDLQAGLKIEGATPLQLTRVNDTQVDVRLAGAAGGAVGFSVPNALGTATGKPSLQVVAQGAFPYRAVPTAGNKGGIVFDPRRQAVYTANKTLQSVMRFAWNGSSWDIASTPVSSVDMVALAPDGASIVATSTSSGIVLLDPATLAVQGSYGPTAVDGDTLNSLPRLAVTNDGRAYYAGQTWDPLKYFDLVTRRFGVVPNTDHYSFYSGPWFSVSGDGARLNIVQTAGLSPSQPMLYLDSADRTPKVNPAGLYFWYESAQSLRGERFVEGTYRVYDRSFAVIGDLVIPGTDFFGRTPVVSPDGNRVYVLAYSSNSLSGYAGNPEMPRVYVFDSSTRMTVSTQLPLLGYFTLPDYPTCSISDYYCNTRGLGTISPDGRTLFFIGDAHLVATPIPALLTPVQATPLQRGTVSTAPKLQRLPFRR